MEFLVKRIFISSCQEAIKYEINFFFFLDLFFDDKVIKPTTWMDFFDYMTEGLFLFLGMEPECQNQQSRLND